MMLPDTLSVSHVLMKDIIVSSSPISLPFDFDEKQAVVSFSNNCLFERGYHVFTIEIIDPLFY